MLANRARKALSSKTKSRRRPRISMPNSPASQPIRPKKAARVAFGPSRKSNSGAATSFDRAQLGRRGEQFLVQHHIPAIARIAGASGVRAAGPRGIGADFGGQLRQAIGEGLRHAARAGRWRWRRTTRASSCTPVNSVRRSAEGRREAAASFSSMTRSSGSSTTEAAGGARFTSASTWRCSRSRWPATGAIQFARDLVAEIARAVGEREAAAHERAFARRR